MNWYNATLMSTTADENINPPLAAKHPFVITAHGDSRTDNWYWLRNQADPEVIAYLEKENLYAKAANAHLRKSEERLYEEIKNRIAQNDRTVPVKRGNWLYYSCTFEGKSYPVYYRKPAVETATEETSTGGTLTKELKKETEEIILDQNELSNGEGYCGIGVFEPSPNHRFLAYSLDNTGNEVFELKVKDLETGLELPFAISETSYSLAWANDSSSFFYTKLDETLRPYQLWRHRLGSTVETDELLWTENDPRYYLSCSKSKDNTYIFLNLESKTTSEVWIIDANAPEKGFSVVAPRQEGMEYSVEHHLTELWILTNYNAADFRIMRVPVDDPDRYNPQNWIELVPHRPGIRIEQMEVFADYLVIHERSGGYLQIVVMQTSNNEESGLGREVIIDRPELVSTCIIGPNPEATSNVLRYEYTSLVTPWSVYDYYFLKHTSFLRKRQAVLGGYDPEKYQTDRITAASKDGTAIPISVAYRKDLHDDNLCSPTLLYAYGAYEISTDPIFSSSRLSLLDRGFIYAIAHVRGGGEMGRRWYQEGKLQHKHNTFDDLVACGRHLIKQGWTSRDKLVIRGGSAGGAAITQAVNLDPSLWKAVVAEVPFVDCLTTMMDDTLPLTATEWDEWGNPKDDPKAYEWIKKWSPYDNLSDRYDPAGNLGVEPSKNNTGHYPDMLITAGINDPRVGYWEPAKLVAKLRHSNYPGKIIFKCEMGAGHHGPSGRYDAWKQEAFVLAFILDSVSISDSCVRF
ncbi:MAG: S9 family peptidase [Actinobacteria bacterium]|nr:S9 family peptidase [Actinomycetota bacterium]MCL6105445.1 S9 family peptidase [Actinomycetota bacterium]